MSGQIISMLVTGGLSVMTLFLVIWVVHLALKNAGVVDIGWGLGFILLCAIDILKGEGFNPRNTVLFVMIALWGLRIALFLMKRIAGEGHEDKRYQKIRREWGGNMALKFLFFFEFQALLEVIIAVPFVVVALNPAAGLSWIEIAGAAIFAAALIGETVADEQLHAFKREEANRGQVCDRGLWKYSRHPNYFFEWLVWVGIFVFALGSPHGWVSVVSPLIMYYLVMYVSGVPLAEEQSLKSRGELYRRYQERTSVFFPMPPK